MKDGMSDNAINNRKAIEAIKAKMLSGSITHLQARQEAKPIIDAMNERAKEISKEHGMRHKPITFTNLMR